MIYVYHFILFMYMKKVEIKEIMLSLVCSFAYSFPVDQVVIKCIVNSDDYNKLTGYVLVYYWYIWSWDEGYECRPM